MALQLNDATAIINRTTNLVPANSDYMCCFWYQPAFVSTSPDYIAPFAVTDAGYTAWTGIFGNASVSAGQTHVNVSNGGAPVTTSPDHTIQATRKVHLGYRRSGNGHFFYVNGIYVDDVTLNITAVTFAEMLLGNDRFSVVDSPLIIWDFKEWNDDKSIQTLREEMITIGRVAVPTNLWCYAPLVDDLADDSGNGYNLGGAGNYEFVTQPTLPVNLHPENALPLSFDLAEQTVEQEIDASAAMAIPVFYAYDNTSGPDKVISISYWGDLVTPGYNPAADGFCADDPEFIRNSNTNIYDGFINGSATFPIPAGKRITFVFENGGLFPSDMTFAASTLHIKTLGSPTGGMRSGDLLIRSASFSGGPDIDEVPEYIGLHAGIIRPGVGVVGYIPFFPAGETGDVFKTTKRLIVVDEGLSWPDQPPGSDYLVLVFNSTGTAEIARSTMESPVFPPTIGRMHAQSETYYLIGHHVANVAKYATFDADGNKAADVQLPGTGSPSAICPNVDQSILYVAISGVIKRLDIASNTYSTNLAAAVASHDVTDLLVMDDDTILACYFKATVTRAMFVRQYDTAGTVLQTYTPTFSDTIAVTAPRLGYAWR